MGIKFFGHYLLDEGKLTKDQLVEIVNYQAKHNLSLGELAVKQELITEKQAQTINDKQRSLDKRFGEVAISLQLLDDTQIQALLATQKQTKVFFGEVLLIKNLMTQEELDTQLKNFELEQKLETIELNDEIKAIDKEGILQTSIEILQTLYSRIVHSPLKLVCINPTSQSTGIMSLQKMRGDIHLNFALQPEDSVSLAIATKLIKMDIDEIDEMTIDIINEFTNVVLGNIAVKLSVGSTKVDLAPPVEVNVSTFNYNDYHSFEFASTQGNLKLCLKL